MKLTDDELKQLREAHAENERSEARLGVTRSQLNFLVVDLFQRHQLRQGSLAICLDCGGFFPRATGCDCGQPNA